MKVAVVGLGHLGLPLALLLAESGRDVTAIDIDPDSLDRCKRGDVGWHERDLQQMLDDHGQGIDWRSDVADAAEADVVFVVVPTPSLPSGAFDVSVVESVLACIDQTARNGLSPVLCCVSTVNPGDCARIAQGLTAPLVYSPELVALGDVFAGMRRPDLIMVGESDRASGDKVLACLRAIKPGRPHDAYDGQMVPLPAPALCRMTTTEAEIAKLSVNVYVTQKISYANTLGELCHRYKSRAAVVADAVGADSRIGRAYLRPGGAYGGPCFPRDGAAFARAAERVGVEAPLADATMEVNGAQVWRWATEVDWHMPGRFPDEKEGTVAVLGTAYKPGTEVTEESFGIAMTEHLESGPYIVQTFDPLAPSSEGTAEGAMADALVVVLATDDPMWAKLDFTGKVVLDPWGLPIHTEGVKLYVGPS